MSEEKQNIGEGKFQKRQTAYWVTIEDLSNGTFKKTEENLVYLTKKGFAVSRVNVCGIVLSKDATEFVESLTIEDGTGNIGVKSFEKKNIFEKIDVGDFVNIIGKIREYNGIPFVSSEIIVKSDKNWFMLRKKEICLIQKFYKTEKVTVKEEVGEEFVVDNGATIMGLIKSLDKGDGADIEEVIKNAGIKECNKIIEDLVRNGDVFEIMPGKLKILD